MSKLLEKMAKNIKAFFSRFNTKKFIYDTPSIPWSNGAFSFDVLDEDIHLQPLIQLLKRYCPDLYVQLRWVVLESARQAKREQEKLDELETLKEKLATEAAACEAAIDEQIEPQPPEFELEEKPQEPWYGWVLTIGLSIMLVLGLCEYLGVNLQDLSWDQTVPLLQALFGAICINLGEKLAIETFVESYRKYEPKRNHVDDEELKNNVPFWTRYLAGDSAIWAATLIVVCETGFATPGLISLLPPSASADKVMQLVAFSAAGLAAIVNVLMAWGLAQARINWRRERLEIEAKKQQWFVEERERLAQSEPMSQEQRAYRIRAAAAKSRIQIVEQKIIAQQEKLSDAKERARLEHERWEYSLKRWQAENGIKVESSYNSQLMRSTEETDLSKSQINGHQPVKDLRI